MNVMRKGRIIALFAVLVVLSPGAVAPEAGGLARAVELAAHTRLMEVATVAGAHPDAFTTDGCSGGMSASWSVAAKAFRSFAATHAARPPWEACCVTHDRSYHAAAGAVTAEASYAARRSADQELRACVIATGEARRDQLAEAYGMTPAQVSAAYAAGADAIFASVRVGGGPCTGLPWRWGYGFPDCP